MIMLVNILILYNILVPMVSSHPQTTGNFIYSRRNYYLRELYASYSTCVIHILDLVGNLQLAPPTLPVIVDGWPRGLEAVENLSSRESGIESVARTRVSSRPSAPKLQQSCFVSFIVAEKKSILADTFSTTDGFILSREGEALRICLRQDVTLGLKLWDENGGVESFLNVKGPIFFPDSAFIFYEGTDVSVGALDHEFPDLDLALFYPSAEHLPTIVLILIDPVHLDESPSGVKKHRDVALLFCLYCDAKTKFLRLTPKNAISTVESRASGYSRQVPWLLSDHDFYWQNVSRLCHITSETTEKGFCAAEYLNMVEIAFANMNSSIARESPVDTSAKSFHILGVTLTSELVELIFPQKDLHFGWLNYIRQRLLNYSTDKFRSCPAAVRCKHLGWDRHLQRGSCSYTCRAP